MQDYFIWQPNPIAVDFGLLKISWYGLTWSASILMAYFLTKIVFKRENKDYEHTTIFVQYIFLGAIIGARIFDVLYYHFDAFIARPMLMLEIMNGGLSSHGAMLGVAVALLLFAKQYEDYTFIWCLDRVAMSMPLLGGFVRIGNFINSELYGKASDLPWAVIFPLSDPQAIPRHPVQLYEALWLFLCFAIFWFIYKTRTVRNGFFSAMFLILVLGGRLIIEFLKDSDTYYGFLSNTQWVSAVAVLIGVVVLVKSQRSVKA
jgi:prolipoprotein diacylglyceryl transferase